MCANGPEQQPLPLVAWGLSCIIRSFGVWGPWGTYEKSLLKRRYRIVRYEWMNYIIIKLIYVAYNVTPRAGKNLSLFLKKF